MHQATIEANSRVANGWRNMTTALRRETWILLGLLVLALLLRMTFFTGFMGSDEVVYTAGAIDFLNGEVAASNYIGLLRYGVNLPVAFFIWLFGPSVAAAGAWAMLCGILEVGLVYGTARALWGLRAAVLSALVLAFLPLHINLSGRLLADTPLAAAITASFYCFLLGNKRDSSWWFFCCGLAVGAVFWIKQAAIIYIIAFPIFAAVMRTFNWKWAWGAAAALLMLFANCAVMYWLQGDPWQAFKVSVQGAQAYGTWTIDDSPWAYFRYLLLDIRHTWLLAYLAIAGVAIAAYRHAVGASTESIRYPALWAAILIVVFSFTVITWDPFRFIMKQSNYLVNFTAPLCLLAGFGVAHMRWRWAIGLMILYAVGGVVLAGLMQQDIHVFRANSVETLAFAKSHPGTTVYASTNAYRLAIFEDVISDGREDGAILKGLAGLDEVREGAAAAEAAGSVRRIAVIDTQTLQRGRDPLDDPSEVPSCWTRLGELPRTEPTGPGSYVVGALLKFSAALPERIGERVDVRLQALQRPEPAYVYEVPAGCGLKDSPPAKKDARSNGQ
jgi:4-amino-4-deoxy-L-arabinose transferase-like glycosyltransferase